jgi:hypothetical protein
VSIYDNFINLKKILNPLFQTGDFVYMAIREKGKLRDLCMVFKPSLSVSKMKKLLVSSDSITKMLYCFILYYIHRAILTKKKLFSQFKKHATYQFNFCLLIFLVFIFLITNQLQIFIFYLFFLLMLFELI